MILNILSTFELLWFLMFALACAAVLFIFQEKLFSRLSARIAVLIFAAGAVVLIAGMTFNEVTSDSLTPPWMRTLQIALVVIGGPIVLGLLAARFVRRPLRQFNEAIATLEQNNYKVQLQSSGVHEFDEVFAKFNDLIHRLEQEEKLRKDLVSDTSHELKTPLTTMIGQLTAIREGKYPMTQERVDILMEQAERLADLVQQLDAYTKARMPDVGEPEDIRLKRFCKELVRNFEVVLKEKGITVKLDIADDYIIRADSSALQQILANLMQNTLRYSKASEVTIAADVHTLQFTDNGKGVPAESLPYLFERFYRVDKSRSRETGGLGLGLAIVRELVEGQGWHISVEREHPGLTFKLSY